MASASALSFSRLCFPKLKIGICKILPILLVDSFLAEIGLRFTSFGCSLRRRLLLRRLRVSRHRLLPVQLPQAGEVSDNGCDWCRCTRIPAAARRRPLWLICFCRGFGLGGVLKLCSSCFSTLRNGFSALATVP